MSIIAQNPFAFNDDKSKFDISRLIVREKITVSIPVPALGQTKRGSVVIPYHPTSNNIDILWDAATHAYNYDVFAITQASTGGVNGIDVSGFNIRKGNGGIYVITNKSVSNPPSAVNVDAYMYYVRHDIIRVLT